MNGVNGMAKRINDAMVQMRASLARLADAGDMVDADWRLSDAAKRERHDELRAAGADSVAKTAKWLFGKVAGVGLDGGYFWQRRDALRAELRAARDLADSLEPARLANTYRRIDAVVARAGSVDELATWYGERADSYERRGLQDAGAAVIARRFPNDASVGGFVARLERERAASLELPAVRAASDAIHGLERAAYDAHSELSRLAGGGAITLDDGVRTLRAVSVDMGFNDVSRADARAVYTVEPSTSAGGVFWNGEMSAD